MNKFAIFAGDSKLRAVDYRIFFASRLICVFALSFVFFITMTNSYAGKAESYELQEKCGKNSLDFFQREGGDKIGDSGFRSYENYYNEKLNKCFIMLKMTLLSTDKKLLEIYTLKDVNSNQDYGGKIQVMGEVTACKVQQVFCHSDSEFRRLIKPFWAAD